DRRCSESELRDRITDALMRDVGVSERMAQPFVESILRCFAGQQPYFPAPPRHYPELQIRGALENGHTPREVCELFNISRRQLHRLFPGGLPKPQNLAG